ncbi:MAG: CotH kinase family protein, partial [Candidatus Symbiothrix sp.]|nr:CotH kinase family protein [Candidatus Symbiothrix sp.]
MQQTNIPDIIIHTTNNQDILDRENYIKGIVSIISDNGQTIFTDSVEIRGRGNYSWTTFDKKPYRFKLAKKAKILGFPAEARNWTLISNHSDKTLMRNLLAFNLSQQLKMPYTPAGRPVNLYLNGEYKGCYQLCDHIDVRQDRVDIKEMKVTDILAENLTGGYLVEVDAYAESEPKWFRSGRNTKVTVKSPDSEDIMDQQFNYIRNHFNSWESAIYASDYSHPVNGFRRYMDTKTFIRHFLVGEISGNTDT